MTIKLLERSTPASWLTELPPLGMDAKSIAADFRHYFSHTLGREVFLQRLQLQHFYSSAPLLLLSSGPLPPLQLSPENAATFRTIDEGRVGWLESQTDQVSAMTSIPHEFIIPGDTPGGAALDLARAIVRRAERRVAELMHQEEISNKELVRYLNRLSSLIFVLELLENQYEGHSTTLAKEK